MARQDGNAILGDGAKICLGHFAKIQVAGMEVLGATRGTQHRPTTTGNSVTYLGAHVSTAL